MKSHAYRQIFSLFQTRRSVSTLRMFSKNNQCSGTIFTYYVTSPIGDIKISSCDVGLHSVYQNDADDGNFAPDERQPVIVKPDQQDKSITDCKPAMQCYQWLKDYFTLRRASTDIPPVCISVVKTDTFCSKALSLLPKAAPMGSTLTYKDLATLCGNEKASRAAGHAMATNPVSLLIPCHRVVSSSGNPGNYGHGKKNKMKVWLLNFEKESQAKAIEA